MSNVDEMIKKMSLETNIDQILKEEQEQEVVEPLQQSIPDNLSKILKGQVNEQDLQNTIVIMKQQMKFKEMAEEIVLSINTMKQNPMANLKLLILRLLVCAEQSIQGKKQGKYRQQIVFQTICSYLKQHNKNPDQDMQIVLLWLIEEIFSANKKNIK